MFPDENGSFYVRHCIFGTRVHHAAARKDLGGVLENQAPSSCASALQLLLSLTLLVNIYTK